jgi:hypothetical protein
LYSILSFAMPCVRIFRLYSPSKKSTGSKTSMQVKKSESRKT